MPRFADKLPAPIRLKVRVCLVVLLFFAPVMWAEEEKVEEPFHPVGHPEGFELVWQDEFDGDQLDDTKWAVRRPGRVQGVGVIDPDNVAVKDGLLYLTTDWDEETETYRVAMVGSQNKFERAYGYYEARIQVEKENGHHGAFWLQSATYGKYLGDLQRSGTEIDIIEYFGWKTSLSINLHWDGYDKETRQHDGAKVQIPDGSTASDDFHVYAVLWTENEYIFYIDGQEVWRTNKGISGARQFVVLSVLMSDYEKPRADKTRAAGKFPDSMKVDYVRVYRQLNPRQIPAPPEAPAVEETSKKVP